jgi:hypothetical protein
MLQNQVKVDGNKTLEIIKIWNSVKEIYMNSIFNKRIMTVVNKSSYYQGYYWCRLDINGNIEGYDKLTPYTKIVRAKTSIVCTTENGDIIYFSSKTDAAKFFNTFHTYISRRIKDKKPLCGYYITTQTA